MPMPGCSFDYIWSLVQKNASIINPTPFTLELMIAIFWEESLFNNVAQGNATTAGYGQVEATELYRFNARNLESSRSAMKAVAEEAQRKGYLVHGLPPVIKTEGGSLQLSGGLTDDQAVQVSMALVRDMHERKRSRKGILEGYAAVATQGTGRQRVIDGWLRCEAKLLNCSKSDADAVLKALHEARGFDDFDGYRTILFPNVAGGSGTTGLFRASIPSGCRLLQQLPDARDHSRPPMPDAFQSASPRRPA